MNINKIAYINLFLLGMSITRLAAQDVKPTEKVVSSEIEVIRPYKPILAEAVKLRRSPDLDNLKTYKAKFTYQLTDRKLDLNTDIQKLEAQQLAAEKAAELVNNYVKGGIGNLSTLFAEGYVGTGKDQALQSGAFFRHFSQSGKLNKQNESNQQLSVFGRSIGDKATLNGRLNYQRHGLFFYGFNEAQPTLNPEPEKQSFNFIELEGEILNRFSTDENAFSYATKANLYFLNDRFDAKENTFTISGFVNKRVRDLNLGLAANAEIGKTKDLNKDLANHIARLNPYIKLQTKGINIVAGANLVQEFGSNSTTRIFPAITADFTLIPDFLQIFGEVKGDVNRTSLKSLSDENPFLNSNINIQNSIEKLSISAGIKGTAGPGFGYKARFYNKTITDMPLFVNNFSKFNRFDVIYDFGDMNLFGIEGELSVQVSDQFKWTAKLNFEDYKPAAEQESFYKPQLRINSNLQYQFNKKLTLSAAVVVQDDSKAKLFLINPLPNPQSSYLPVPNLNNETVVTVKGFVDLGLGADYKINDRFGAFVKVNNLLNSNYSRFVYYPVNGINIFGGLSYSF